MTILNSSDAAAVRCAVWSFAEVAVRSIPITLKLWEWQKGVSVEKFVKRATFAMADMVGFEVDHTFRVNLKKPSYMTVGLYQDVMRWFVEEGYLTAEHQPTDKFTTVFETHLTKHDEAHIKREQKRVQSRGGPVPIAWDYLSDGVYVWKLADGSFGMAHDVPKNGAPCDEGNTIQEWQEWERAQNSEDAA